MDPVPKGADLTAAGTLTEFLVVEVSTDYLFFSTLTCF